MTRLGRERDDNGVALLRLTAEVWRGSVTISKNKWHIHNALDAKNTAGLVHNGERGFQMHILWL